MVWSGWSGLISQVGSASCRRWDDSLFKWLNANSAPDQRGRLAASGEFSLWHNLNHNALLPGSQTLLTFLGDPQSSRYEGWPDDAVQAALMARLREQHPSTLIPAPTAFFISRHGYDQKSFGAYSVFSPGWRDRFFDTLTKPLAPQCDGHRREVKV